MTKIIPPKGIAVLKNIVYISCVILLSAVVPVSCTTTKNSYYFKTIPKDTSFSTSNNTVADTKIHKADLLSINISSLNREEDLVYNAPAISMSGGVTGSSSSGYLVDDQGNIQVHRIGIIHAEGMTRHELKDKIQTGLTPYLKDVVVTVRYLNHRITVLGEVAKPTVIPMPEERLSLLEALGTGGDVTVFAKRNNILIIRETDKGKETKRINLEDHSILTSDWYWLQPNDVVYVEPNDKKVNEENRSRRQQTISIGLSALSIAIVILSRVIK
jgi:polysaccharide export outer membrane protein